MKNKRGITDIILAIVMFFIVAVVIVFGIYLSNQLIAGMTPELNSLDSTNRSSALLTQSLGTSTMVGDSVFMMVFFCLVLGIIITSFMVYTHPIFIVIWIILSLVSLVLATILSNAYEAITAGVLATSSALTPMLNWIMLNLPLVVLGIIIISIIVVYVKSRSPMQGGTI